MLYVYAAIGRAVVWLAWRRYGDQIRFLALAGALVVGLAAWLAAGRDSGDRASC